MDNNTQLYIIYPTVIENKQGQEQGQPGQNTVILLLVYSILNKPVKRQLGFLLDSVEEDVIHQGQHF